MSLKIDIVINGRKVGFAQVCVDIPPDLVGTHGISPSEVLKALMSDEPRKRYCMGNVELRPSEEAQATVRPPSTGKSLDAMRIALQAAASAVAETPIARNNYAQYSEMGDAHATRSACVAAVRRIDPAEILQSSFGASSGSTHERRA